MLFTIVINMFYIDCLCVEVVEGGEKYQDQDLMVAGNINIRRTPYPYFIGGGGVNGCR